MKKNKAKKKLLKANMTSPLFDDAHKDKTVNLAVPSDDDVTEAKNWVDFNKL